MTSRIVQAGLATLSRKGLALLCFFWVLGGLGCKQQGTPKGSKQAAKRGSKSKAPSAPRVDSRVPDVTSRRKPPVKVAIGPCPLELPAHPLCQMWKKCQARDAETCTQIGHQFTSGLVKNRPDEKKGLRFFRLGCQLGHGEACTLINKMPPIELGRKAPKELIATYKQACAKKSAQTCDMLSQYYSSLPQPDLALAFQFTRKACSYGHASACTTLGKSYQLGQPPLKKEDPKKAREFYKLGCQLGSGFGCVEQAIWLMKSGDGEDAKQGIALMEKTCKGGEPTACGHVGLLVLRGKLPSEGKALTAYLQQGCDSSLGKACLALGQLYLTGKRGLRRSSKKALPLLVKACEFSQKKGCQISLKMRGRLARRQVSRLEQVACRVGLHHICYALGLRKLKAKDLLNAQGLFQQACLSKYRDSCQRVVRLHEALASKPR